MRKFEHLSRLVEAAKKGTYHSYKGESYNRIMRCIENPPWNRPKNKSFLKSGMEFLSDFEAKIQHFQPTPLQTFFPENGVNPPDSFMEIDVKSLPEFPPRSLGNFQGVEEHIISCHYCEAWSRKLHDLSQDPAHQKRVVAHFGNKPIYSTPKDDFVHAQRALAYFQGMKNFTDPSLPDSIRQLGWQSSRRVLFEIKHQEIGKEFDKLCPRKAKNFIETTKSPKAQALLKETEYFTTLAYIYRASSNQERAPHMAHLSKIESEGKKTGAELKGLNIEQERAQLPKKTAKEALRPAPPILGALLGSVIGLFQKPAACCGR